MGNDVYQTQVARDYVYSSSEASTRFDDDDDDDDVAVETRKTNNRRKRILVKFMNTILPNRNKSSTSLALIFDDDSSINTDLEQTSIYSETPTLTYKELNKASKHFRDLEQGSRSIYFQHSISVLSYKVLDESTNHFDSKRKLGDGRRGSVYHGRLRDGRVAAVKRLFGHRVEQFMNEIEILSRLRHHNLVSIYGRTTCHSRELLLVYEYVPNGTLADHLHGNRASNGCLTWSVRLSIAIEFADALAYLHASGIIHRNITTDKLLLDNDFHVKLAGFGLSRLIPIPVMVTDGHVDPEYYSDVYRLGVVLIELISSKPVLDNGWQQHHINLDMAIKWIHNQALHELVDASLGFNSDDSIRKMITMVAELAFRCLQQKKEMRMTEVLETLKGIKREEYTKMAHDRMCIQ